MTSAVHQVEIRPSDFLGSDQSLSDEERDIRDTVRSFVRDRVVPHVGDWFEEARVPRELAPDPEVTSLRGPLSCLNEARYGIVWGAAGAARACFEAALSYSKERIAFGRPIAATQIRQHKLATMALEVNRATLLALHLGRMKDARAVCVPSTSAWESSET